MLKVNATIDTNNESSQVTTAWVKAEEFQKPEICSSFPEKACFI